MAHVWGSKPGEEAQDFVLRWGQLLGDRGFGEVLNNLADIYRETAGFFEHVIYRKEGPVWRLDHDSRVQVSEETYLCAVRVHVRDKNPDFTVCTGRGKWDLAQAKQELDDERSGAALERRRKEARYRRINALREEHARPKMTKGKVQILKVEGYEEKDADLLGGWAVIREVDHRGKPQWNLTHRYSGMKAGVFAQRQWARQMASILAQGAPWLEKRPRMTEEEQSAFLAAFGWLGRADALPYTASLKAEELLKQGMWPELVLGPDPAKDVK